MLISTAFSIVSMYNFLAVMTAEYFKMSTFYLGKKCPGAVLANSFSLNCPPPSSDRPQQHAKPPHIARDYVQKDPIRGHEFFIIQISLLRIEDESTGVIAASLQSSFVKP